MSISNGVCISKVMVQVFRFVIHWVVIFFITNDGCIVMITNKSKKQISDWYYHYNKFLTLPTIYDKFNNLLQKCKYKQ